MYKIMNLISHKDNNKLVKNFLLSLDYEVLSVKEKNHKALFSKVDLIIIDESYMFALRDELRAIKSQNQSNYVPVLLLTDKKSNLGNEYIKLIDEILNMPVKKEEFELRMSNLLNTREMFSRLNKILDNSPTGICVLEEGKIEYFNPSFINILGKEAKDLYNCNFLELFESDSDHRIIQLIEKPGLIEENSEQEIFEIKLKDSNRWCEVSFSNVYYNKKTAILVNAADITERKEAKQRLRYISFHDTLTGLYNRAYLEEEMKRLDTERQLPLSLIMIDLNGLKLVNDTYGHEKGDEMLKTAAEIVKNNCREEDIIARWGGDEFVILLPQTNEQQLDKICKRIKNSVREVHIKDIPLSLALGTSIKQEKFQDIGRVLKEAEDNMYKNKLSERRSVRNSMLHTLLSTLQAKSYETEQHSQRMLVLAWKLGEKLGLSESELYRLELLITLHDIGKINIPEEILTKKGLLSETEWEMIKKHPEIGYRIAVATEEFSHVANDILSHHERWDGEGYPKGLEGKEIPLLARIVAIVDAYDVMSNERPYKKAKSQDEIIEEFKNYSGSQFDPELVDLFFDIIDL